MVLNKHECPYCNKKISFSKMFSIKTDLEYCCDNCHEISQIKIDKKINTLVIALIVACVAVVFVFSFLLRWLIVGTLILLLLFLGFYFLVPNFLEISPIKTKTLSADKERTN